MDNVVLQLFLAFYHGLGHMHNIKNIQKILPKNSLLGVSLLPEPGRGN